MSKRKRTPSLMDDLLFSGDRAQQDAGKTESQQDDKTASPTSLTPDRTEKTKATFYIAQYVLDDLDSGQLELRRMAPRARKRQISKSTLVEAALKIVLEDLEKHGDTSLLARHLLGG